MAKKKKEQAVEPEPDAVEASEPDAPAAPAPAKETAEKPVLIDTFIGNSSTLNGKTLGAAFRRWCEVQDKGNVRVRKSNEEWLTLFDQFMKREVH